MDRAKEKAHVDLTPSGEIEYFGDTELTAEERAFLGPDGGIAVEDTPEAIDKLIQAAENHAGTDKGMEYLAALSEISKEKGTLTQDGSLAVTGKNWRVILNVTMHGTKMGLVAKFQERKVPLE